MSRIGITIKSANKNAITPPKLLPPFHKTAARGTFPTEQTNDNMATIGPTSGLQNFVSKGWDVRKNDCHAWFGTQVAKAPANSKPPAMSFQIAAQSITK